MKKIDRRIQKTKDSIHNAFIHLIQIKEYNSITITEIASIANIDRKTFYLHYTSIDDVLKEFSIEAAEAVRVLLQENRPFDIRLFFQGLTNIMEDNICFYRHVSSITSYAFFLSQCKNILKSSLKDSFFSKSELHENVFDVYSEFIASGIIGIYTNWLISDSKMNLAELTTHAIDAVSNAWEKIV
ncbi:TetR/AcrR family transcriptional regulator (plasmid) [Clostridium estertheticum]|uniref:TetR/AcrR family transcriptional regulator n=1 Tax=Clostridium estertheticum TaxID=238834 RepID=UPI001C0C15C7|nr:TetR/AcrR family transcriptional regulator [Clostridium estertheticum]MBU3217359.1 TetR/AcrR family transcriptional regulator [Clostridium estertheticum]WAG58134.1 TetR/AcrR family transcriptional regulator [Clostridium estertheticum]